MTQTPLPDAQDQIRCPACLSSSIRKHGQHLGKQRYFCKNCSFAFTGAQYQTRPQHEINALAQENKRLARLVLSAISLRQALRDFHELDNSLTRKNLKAKELSFDRLIEKTPFPEMPETEERSE